MIAVCVSGITSMVPEYKLIREVQAKVFPYDTFFLQWNGYPKADLPNVSYVDEPTWDYHVLSEVKAKPNCPIFRKYTKKPHGKIYRKSRPRMYKQFKTSANQIMSHAHLVNSLDPKYTTIIKLRFDTIVSTRADYSSYIKMAEQGITVGFDADKGKKNYGANPNMTIHQPKDCDRCHARIWDHMLMHPRARLKNVFEMKEQQKLCGAEWGWYQILAEQWNDNNFINVLGGETIAKWCIAPKEEWLNI